MALQRTSSFSSDGFSDASSLEIVSRHVFELDMRLRRLQPAVDELAATLAAQILSHDATRRRLLDFEERLSCMQTRLQAHQAQLRCFAWSFCCELHCLLAFPPPRMMESVVSQPQHSTSFGIHLLFVRCW